MHFDERNIGDYRVYAGALEGPLGDGYIAALVVVQRVQGVPGAPREVLRDENMAGGHRWRSADAALAYAIGRAREAIRNESQMLAC